MGERLDVIRRPTPLSLEPLPLELHPGADTECPRTAGDDVDVRANAAHHGERQLVTLVEDVGGEQLQAVLAPVVTGEQIYQRVAGDRSGDRIVRDIEC